MFTPGIYWVRKAQASGTQPVYDFYMLVVESTGYSDTTTQIAYNMDNAVSSSRIYANGNWSAWERTPTRAEVDELNSKGDYSTIANSGSVFNTIAGKSYWTSTGLTGLPGGNVYGYLDHILCGRDSAQRMLKFVPYNAPATFFIATSNNSGTTWSKWYRYTGTQVSES